MNDQDHTLNDSRRQLDALDAELLRLIAQRMDIVRSIGKYKKAHDLPALDQARWQAVLDSLAASAESLHQSPVFITGVYQLIHEQALKIEDDIINGPS